MTDARLEPAFIAQALALPSEADIAREIGTDIDPDAIFQARQALRAAIGQRLAGTLAETYDQHDRMPAPIARMRSAPAARYLKNTCLDLLAADGNAGGIARAARQYRAATNMTDRMAALSTLSLHDVPRARGTGGFLRTLFRRSAYHRQVVFAAGRIFPKPPPSTRVRDLTAHPAFSLANPNRVRALIGAFAHGNPTQFNRPDGAGYEFIAETVLTLDEKNPQVAARLALGVQDLAHDGGQRVARTPKRLCAALPRRQSFRATSMTSSNVRLPTPARQAASG